MSTETLPTHRTGLPGAYWLVYLMFLLPYLGFYGTYLLSFIWQGIPVSTFAHMSMFLFLPLTLLGIALGRRIRNELERQAFSRKFLVLSLWLFGILGIPGGMISLFLAIRIIVNQS